MRFIDKLPRVPNLNEKTIRMISDLLFVPDVGYGRCVYYAYDTKSVLQIMGNIAFLKDMFSDETQTKIYNQPKIPRLIIASGTSPFYGQDNEEVRWVKMLYTEGGKYDWNDVLTTPGALIINERLQKTMRYNPWTHDKKPLLETNSKNTKENIVNVREIGGYRGVEELRLLTTAESTLRAIATARKHLPELKNIASISYIPTFPALNLKVDRKNWAKGELSRRYVYGELLRVAKYDETEDISLTDSEKRKLYAVIEELSLKQR